MADNNGYISSALRGGGDGESNFVDHKKVSRGQEICTGHMTDNVDLAMPMKSALRGSSGFAGSPTNLSHSINGATAVSDEGAAGPVHRTVINNH